MSTEFSETDTANLLTMPMQKLHVDAGDSGRDVYVGIPVDAEGRLFIPNTPSVFRISCLDIYQYPRDWGLFVNRVAMGADFYKNSIHTHTIQDAVVIMGHGAPRKSSDLPVFVDGTSVLEHLHFWSNYMEMNGFPPLDGVIRCDSLRGRSLPDRLFRRPGEQASMKVFPIVFYPVGAELAMMKSSVINGDVNMSVLVRFGGEMRNLKDRL